MKLVSNLFGVSLTVLRTQCKLSGPAVHLKKLAGDYGIKNRQLVALINAIDVLNDVLHHRRIICNIGVGQLTQERVVKMTISLTLIVTG